MHVSSFLDENHSYTHDKKKERKKENEYTKLVWWNYKKQILNDNFVAF